MVKIMLVEDDKSLREIYGARLLAEGYDIVSAGDGEEALAIAIKEKPGLIISDVMMPKISGFDMLDILRSSSETRNTKVIMMTALSSDDQRQRGEQLGADRYLVKSQVGIEDVVRVVHEVLEDSTEQPTVESDSQLPDQPAQVAAPTPAAAPAQAEQDQQAAEPEQSSPSQDTSDDQPAPDATESASRPQAPSNTSQPNASLGHARTIQPLNDPHRSTVDINELLDKEIAKEASVDPNNRPVVASTEQERNLVQDQINQFEQSPQKDPEQPADDKQDGDTTEGKLPSMPSGIASDEEPVASESSQQSDQGDAADQTDEADNSSATPPPPPRPPVAL